MSAKKLFTRIENSVLLIEEGQSLTQKGAFGSKSSYTFLTKEAISVIVQLTILICFSRPIVVFPRCPSIWSGSFSESAFVVVVVLFFSRSSNVSFPKKSATNHFALSRQNSNQNDAQPLMMYVRLHCDAIFTNCGRRCFLEAIQKDASINDASR